MYCSLAFVRETADPPSAYKVSFTMATASPCRGVGMSAPFVQVSV